MVSPYRLGGHLSRPSLCTDSEAALSQAVSPLLPLPAPLLQQPGLGPRLLPLNTLYDEAGSPLGLT